MPEPVPTRLPTAAEIASMSPEALQRTLKQIDSRDWPPAEWDAYVADLLQGIEVQRRQYFDKLDEIERRYRELFW